MTKGAASPAKALSFLRIMPEMMMVATPMKYALVATHQALLKNAPAIMPMMGIFAPQGMKQVVIMVIRLSRSFSMVREAMTPGTPQPVLTLDEAIQKLEEKFDSMIVEGEWRVDEIEMAYIAVPIEGTNDARLLPVWRFQTEHTMEYAGKDDPSQTTTLTDRGDILFNALDGTELLKNNGSI